MAVLLDRTLSFVKEITSVSDFKKLTTIMHFIGSGLMIGGMFAFDTGFLLLQISTYTYMWSFYWGFLILGSLGTIISVLLCLRGFRHYILIWIFLLIGLFGLVAVGSPLNDSFTQVLSRPGCNDAGVGNYCDMNITILAGSVLWTSGMIVALLACIKGSVGHHKIKKY